MSTTTINPKRIAAAAALAGVAATGIALNPAATGDADAANKIRTANFQRAEVLRERVAKVAQAQKGDRYVLGSTGPGAFDCSGLVNYAYRKATGRVLPRTSYALAGSVEHVSKRSRKVGDLVFYRGNGHVGVYIGKGRVAQALNPRVGVVVDRADQGWNRSMIYGYGRVIRTK